MQLVLQFKGRLESYSRAVREDQEQEKKEPQENSLNERQSAME